MQIRHEEFLLFGSLVQKLQGQSSFSIVREALRIRLSVFWLRTSPNNFYQNFRSVNIPNKEIEYQNSYLSRRHVVAGKVNQGGSDSNRYSVFSLQHLGFITNLKKSILTPQQKIEFLGLLVDSVIVFDSRETDESDQPMFGDVQNRESVHFTIDKAYRSFTFDNTRSVTCKTSVSVFTTNSGRIDQSRPFISTSSNLDFQCKTGTCTTPSTNGDLNGCFQNRLGSIMSGSYYTGSMVQTGEVS